MTVWKLLCCVLAAVFFFVAGHSPALAAFVLFALFALTTDIGPRLPA